MTAMSVFVLRHIAVLRKIPASNDTTRAVVSDERAMVFADTGIDDSDPDASPIQITARIQHGRAQQSEVQTLLDRPHKRRTGCRFDMAENAGLAVERKMTRPAGGCYLLSDAHRQICDDHVQVIGAAFDLNIISPEHIKECRIADIVGLQDDLYDAVRIALG